MTTMTTHLAQSPQYRQQPEPAPNRRLLPYGGRGLTFDQHLAIHGPPAYRGREGMLIDEVREAGLTGRGGAAFPVHRKLTAVLSAGGRPVVVANGAEGEPAAHKDKTLLTLDPHLVLDGLQLAAEAVGARQAYLYVHRNGRLSRRIDEALAQRRTANADHVSVTVVYAPPRFLAGQESALVHRIEGGPAVPRYSPRLVAECGIGGAPTLVQNVETLAHVALIARYGVTWFRSVGTVDEPGTMLASVHPSDAQARVVETAPGASIFSLLDLGNRGAQAVLVGGYHGTWLTAEKAATLTLANAVLRPEGAAIGAGVLAALPHDRCGVRETARVLRYLADESAGQCGPCLNGLPRIADAWAVLAGPGEHQAVRADLTRWANLLDRRGACHHPDGSMRFARSAFTVFAEEIWRHARGTCTGTNGAPFLPLPSDPPLADEDWS
jgi:NADH:ubiquinone oxidoreductase subunit F (NADH-binding)